MTKFYLHKTLVFLLLFNVLTVTAKARTLYAISASGGDWNTPGNWSTSAGGASCNCIPASTDDVVITCGYYISIVAGANLTCASLEIINDKEQGTVSAGLSLTNTSSLIVSGNVHMNGNYQNSVTKPAVYSINLNGGRLTVNGNLTMTGKKPNNNKSQDEIIDLGVGGILTVAGNISLNNSDAIVEIRAGYSNTIINIGGSFTFQDSDCNLLNGTGTFGTINYNGNGNQSVAGATGSGTLYYNNLIVSNTGTKTATADFVVNSSLIICDAAVLDAGTYAITGAASLTMTGGEFKLAKLTATIPQLTGLYNLSSGKVTLYGSGAQVLRGETYNNIEFNNSYTTAPQISLAGNVIANGTVTLTSGKVALGNYNMTIAHTGIITGYAAAGSASTKYIITNGTGGLIQNNVGPTGRAGSIFFPVGYSGSSYTPVTILNTGTTDNFTVNISDNVYLTPPSTGMFTSGFIKRTANVSEGIVGGSNVSMTIQWASSDEMNGFNRSYCSITHYSNGWTSTQSGAIANNSGPYSRTTTGITSFSPFTIESSGALPIQLLSFNLFKDGEKVGVAWKTAVEIDNDFFTIERSLDGWFFYPVLEVEGAGNSSQTVSYTEYDETPYLGVSYYRIKQTDYNGKYTYSPVKSVETDIPKRELTLFPNPSNGSDLYISSKTLEKDEEVLVVVYDALGNLKYSKVITREDGSIFTATDPSERLKPGIYYVVGSIKNGMKQQKLVIK